MAELSTIPVGAFAKSEAIFRFASISKFVPEVRVRFVPELKVAVLLTVMGPVVA